MNELDRRLAAWNPVHTADVLDATTTDAADLLQHILSQPTTSRSPRPSPWLRRPTRIWIAAAAAIAVVAAGISMSVNLPGRGKAHLGSGRPVIGFQRGPSQGLATNVVELVDYATKAAAMTPAFVPGPRDWMYVDLLDRGPYSGPRGYHDQTWTQIGAPGRVATLEHGKLSYGGGGGPGAQLSGWPGNWSTLYHYLARLPADPVALRQIVLTNNHFKPAAAFNAVMYLMNDFPLPARFQAELYAVLAALAGVHFDRSAIDAAGRRGIGLYIVENRFLKKEVIINPRSYAYMGLLWVAVKAHTEHGTSPAVLHLHKGSIQGWNAILNSGIVNRAGCPDQK